MDVCTAIRFLKTKWKNSAFTRSPCLALIDSVEEGNDLGSGTDVIRFEQAAANTVRYTVLYRPCHSICIVAVSGNIAERGLAVNRFADSTEQERHTLCAGAGGVGTEFTAARAGGNAVLYRPSNRFCIIAAGRNIRKAACVLRFGRTGSTPQECDNLCAGTAVVRSK